MLEKIISDVVALGHAGVLLFLVFKLRDLQRLHDLHLKFYHPDKEK